MKLRGKCFSKRAIKVSVTKTLQCECLFFGQLEVVEISLLGIMKIVQLINKQGQ